MYGVPYPPPSAAPVCAADGKAILNGGGGVPE